MAMSLSFISSLPLSLTSPSFSLRLFHSSLPAFLRLTYVLQSQSNYEQLVTEGYLDPTTLDRIFGDVGDVLVQLLEALFAGAGEASTGHAIVDKVLSVAELILHDEKVFIYSTCVYFSFTECSYVLFIVPCARSALASFASSVS